MLDNADKLISKLDKLAKVDNLNEVLNQACILVENQAKINCPVKYGTLRNSITHEVEGLQGVVGTNIEYAPYVELGINEYLEEFKDAEINDYPVFVNHGIDRYPESGHIMVLVADYMTPRNQSIIIYFKHKSMLSAFDTIRLYAEDYKVLIDSLGEDLYTEIYNKMKEYYRD